MPMTQTCGKSSALRATLVTTLLLVGFIDGCATIRVTDPNQTATEQFLMTEAARQAISQLSTDGLRDRKVFLDWQYLTASRETGSEILFAIGEMRAKLLTTGVRLVDKRDEAQIILELRAAGIGVDRSEYLLGIPATAFPAGASSSATISPTVGIATPELAFLKSTTQQGYASLAFVAFWADTGEIVTQSGPFIGHTLRKDWWVLGTGPYTHGNITTTPK